MQYIRRMYILETAQYLIQEIADVIVTQSLRTGRKREKKSRNENFGGLWDDEESAEDEDLWFTVNGKRVYAKKNTTKITAK